MELFRSYHSSLMYKVCTTTGVSFACSFAVYGLQTCVSSSYNQLVVGRLLLVAILQAILGATQRSFAAMKRRLGSKATTGIFYMERPFFNVDVELKVRATAYVYDLVSASAVASSASNSSRPVVTSMHLHALNRACCHAMLSSTARCPTLLSTPHWMASRTPSTPQPRPSSRWARQAVHVLLHCAGLIVPQLLGCYNLHPDCPTWIVFAHRRKLLQLCYSCVLVLNFLAGKRQAALLGHGQRPSHVL